MRILVATGASGGHIFPALSFLSSLKEKNSGIEGLLVLPLRSSGIKFQTADFKVRYISMPKLALAINIKNSLVLFKFIQAWVESFFILLSFKPDVVVGFGTIDSLPLVMLAWFLRVKTLIHEQNVIPGRANKLLAKFSDAIAVSFAKTKDYLRVDIAKISVTGNPLRRELKRIDRDEAWEFFGFEPGKFTLLVMGGSQGSHRINSCFLDTLLIIPGLSKLQVIHIFGDKDYEPLKNKYKDLPIRIKSFPFLAQMQYAYSAADLVISRAGAITIAELIYFKLPAIILPYPFAQAHQLSNAQVLEDAGSAVVIKDNELTPSKLGECLSSFINSPERLKKMQINYDNIAVNNAHSLLAEAAISLI